MKKKRRRKKKSRVRRFFSALFKLFLAVMVLCAAAVASYVFYIASESDPIDPAKIYSSVDKTSYVYDRNGKEIDKLYYTEDRTILSADEIPEQTKNAFIAIEDKTFYEHHGFNYRRMAGAVLNKLLGKSASISGTSTITQQLARNVFLADTKSDRTIERKVREMYYAFQIEQTLSKDEILEAYLNTIYLGYGCYGINAASMTYFGKDAKDLDLAESAALAALPQAPDLYALLQNEEGEHTTYLKKLKLYANDASKDRRDLVLALMKEQGYITKEEVEEATVDVTDILHPHFDKAPAAYTYFSDYVASAVAADLSKEMGLTDEEAERLVHTGGLHIYTTIDPKAQKVIISEFSNDYNFPWSEEEPQAAMVITEVDTGKIRAMVGGRGTVGRKLFNRATSPRQPGSSIKPLTVYSAALQKSSEYAAEGKTFPLTDFGIDKQGTSYWGDYITASSYVADERVVINGQAWPLNANRIYTGRNTFRTALQQSINTCAVKIQMQVGADYSMKMLKKYGISTAVDDDSQATNDMNSAAMALGAMTYGVTPLDMALAYGTFPAGGVRCSAVCYDKVTDSEGNVLLEGKAERTQVLDEGVAFIMTDVLKSAVSRGIASAASIYGVEVGGKTGTTNDTYDIWFCGFTPKYSAALWIGTDHNKAMSTTSSTAAALWSQIMSQVPGVTKGEYLPQPYDVTEKYGEYYTLGTEPYGAPPAPPRKSKSSGGSSGGGGSSSSRSNDGFYVDDDDSGSSHYNPDSQRYEFYNNSGSGGNDDDDWF